MDMEQTVDAEVVVEVMRMEGGYEADSLVDV
jgi:hypothetical protein